MLPRMFKRQTTGSVVCPSCGSLVGVNDDKCYTCGRRNPGLWGYAPLLRRLGNDFGFLPLVLYGCTGLYMLSLLLTLKDGGDIMGGGIFSILSPGGLATLRLGMSGADPVFGLGMWWTVLSAGWLHGSALHILFNMMALRQIGPITADIYGGSRVVIIYVVSSACGFLLSSVAGVVMPSLPIIGGARATLGASAAIFGLVGSLMYYGRRGGSSLMTSQLSSWLVSMVIFGVIVPRIDNYAHAGGFAGGYLVGMWLDPLRPQRITHMVGAVVCLFASVLAIVASYIWVSTILG
jgi:membrane associated rhomboid family serine protease